MCVCVWWPVPALSETNSLSLLHSNGTGQISSQINTPGQSMGQIWRNFLRQLQYFTKTSYHGLMQEEVIRVAVRVLNMSALSQTDSLQVPASLSPSQTLPLPCSGVWNSSSGELRHCWVTPYTVPLHNAWRSGSCCLERWDFTQCFFFLSELSCDHSIQAMFLALLHTEDKL